MQGALKVCLKSMDCIQQCMYQPKGAASQFDEAQATLISASALAAGMNYFNSWSVLSAPQSDKVSPHTW